MAHDKSSLHATFQRILIHGSYKLHAMLSLFRPRKWYVLHYLQRPLDCALLPEDNGILLCICRVKTGAFHSIQYLGSISNFCTEHLHKASLH